MKLAIILLFTIFITSNASSQAPDRMSYQAVVRNVNNLLVANSTIGMRISILHDSTTGPSVYVEEQTPSSNINGLVTIIIGNGNVISGSILNIDWSDGPYFIKTEIDPTGSSNYTINSTSQFLSVPYSLYAKHTEYSGRKVIDTLSLNNDFTVILGGCNDTIQFISATDTICNYWPVITLLNLPIDQIISSFNWRYVNGVLDSFEPGLLIYEHSYLYFHNAYQLFPGDIITWKCYYETWDDFKLVEFSYPVQ